MALHLVPPAGRSYHKTVMGILAIWRAVVTLGTGTSSSR